MARRSGLSVRALHHYDAIGLLSPSRRSEAGYRLYTKVDQQRLARILLLKSLGFSLEKCRLAIDDESFSLQDCVRMEVDRLEREIQGKARVKERLMAVLSQLRESSGKASIGEIEEIMEAMNMFEKYYTPEQLEQLRQRGESLGEDRIAAVQSEWQQLFAQYQEAMDKGLAPDDPAVKELARRSRSLIEEFTGGDPGIESSLQNMYASEGVKAVVEPHGVPSDPSLWGYMAAAGSSLEE